jgi:hypothetical protein
LSNPAIAEIHEAALSVLHQHLFHLTFNNKFSDWNHDYWSCKRFAGHFRRKYALRLLPEKADRDERAGVNFAQRFNAAARTTREHG